MLNLKEGEAMKLEKVAELVGGKLKGDGSLEISGLRGIEQAGEGHLTFISKKKVSRCIESFQNFRCVGEGRDRHPC